MNTALVRVGGATIPGGQYKPLDVILHDLPPFIPEPPRLNGPAGHKVRPGLYYMAARGPMVGGWTVVRVEWNEAERRWIGPAVTGEGMTMHEADRVAQGYASEEAANGQGGI